MVSFKSLIVIATTAFTVSATTVSKRDLPGDIASIRESIAALDSDVRGIDPQDPNTAMLSLTGDLALFVSTLDNAAIAEEGLPSLSEEAIKETAPALEGLFSDFTDLINGIEKLLPKIQQISGLSQILETGMSQSESVAAAFINSVIGRLPGDKKSKAVAALFEVLEGYTEVLGLLSASA